MPGVQAAKTVSASQLESFIAFLIEVAKATLLETELAGQTQTSMAENIAGNLVVHTCIGLKRQSRYDSEQLPMSARCRQRSSCEEARRNRVMPTGCLHQHRFE